MPGYTMRDDHLEEALEKLCEKLIEKGAMAENDKHKAVAMVKAALIDAYPDGVPQDLFTDADKQKTLVIGLISAPLMEHNPALKFDLGLFFKQEFKPEEVRKLFKTFLTELNKLEPDPNKRRSENEIDKELDDIVNKLQQKKQNKNEEGESSRLVDLIDDEVEELFKILFGMTKFGVIIALSVNKGTMGFIDSYSATSAGGGSIHEGRGLGGDSTTDPYVVAMAKERLEGLNGISAEVLADLTKSGIIHAPPAPKPAGAV